MTNIRKNRIGIKALQTLNSKYDNEIYAHFKEKRENVEKDYNEYVEIFINDLELKDFLKNFVFSSYGNKIEIQLIKEKFEGKICGDNKGIICPLLDEKSISLTQLSEKEDKVRKALNKWYFESLKPHDFIDFELDFS